VVMFKKPRWEKPFPEKLANRVSRIPTSELASWADQSISELGRCISEWEKTRNPVYMEEALNGAEAMHAVVNEMYKRNIK